VEEVEFGDLRWVFYLVEGYEGGHYLWLVLVGGLLTWVREGRGVAC
jgi:hypothetical protein